MRSSGWSWPLDKPHAIPHPDRLGAVVFWPKLEPDFSITADVFVIDDDLRVTNLLIESRNGAEVRSAHLRQVSFPEIRQFLIHRIAELGGVQVDARAAMVEYAEEPLLTKEVLTKWAESLGREVGVTLATHLAATITMSDEQRRQAIDRARAVSQRLAKSKPHRGRGMEKQPEDYLHVALQYLYHYEQHGQRVVKTMTKTLRTQFSDPELPINTVRHWVWRARKEGWLSKGEKGKAGAQPGPRLIEWLKTQEEGADPHGINPETT